MAEKGEGKKSEYEKAVFYHDSGLIFLLNGLATSNFQS